MGVWGKSRHFAWSVAGITAGAFLVVVWISPGFRWSNFVQPLLTSFVYALCIGSLATLAGHLVWPRAARFSTWVRWMLLVLPMCAAVLLGTLMALLILWYGGIIHGSGFWTLYLLNLKFAAFIAATFGLAVMIYEYWRHKYEHSELERERALKLATEARLASLESRIHPHFLFNTLNSISALIHSDADAADEQLQRLSALLRFSLDTAQSRLIPLSKELRIVEDYLQIERTRFGERLRYRIESDDQLADAAVPPFSIQTLAENSVKHVIAPSRAGGEIVVRVRSGPGRLTVEVFDGGPGVSAEKIAPGRGLDNLRSRLQALFDGKAELAFAPSAVRMEMPL